MKKWLPASGLRLCTKSHHRKNRQRQTANCSLNARRRKRRRQSDGWNILARARTNLNRQNPTAERNNMKAIQIQKCGGHEVLTLVDIPAPKLKPNEAVVKVSAAGINFIDVYFREGRYP